jgi:predicted ATP-binding protein involved in virulence
MSFRLIAIRPLEGCNRKFLKNLKENQVYQFYNEYIFNFQDDDKDKDVIGISYSPTTPEELYKQGDIYINISAIVGKNGSGKSSLVELFIRITNQLSYFLLRDKKLETTASIMDFQVEKNDGKIYIFLAEIFYQINGILYKLKIEQNSYSHYKQNEEDRFIKDTNDFKLSNFFYTEIINYSHYAYNSWEIGDWIDNLFHKNDAYQIPIVINPKRENKDRFLAGIIDINNEATLLQQRILVNVLKKSEETDNLNFRKMGDNLIAEKFTLKRKEAKEFFILENNEFQHGENFDNEEKKIVFINKIYSFDNYGISFYRDNYDSLENFIHNFVEVLEETKKYFKIESIKIPELYKFDIYILYKVISICYKYPPYSKYIEVIKSSDSKDRNLINIKEFLKNLDKSHITYKLKQVINFIKYYDKIWKNRVEVDNISIDIESLSEDLNKIVNQDLPLIELLPPPIFETQIVLNNLKDKVEISFDTLSSGEKQLIHSVSSILYHLNNIDSVKEDESRVKYSNVNIVFEEIELYFHPELQRRFVKYLLDSINNIKLRSVKNINIIFVTHSPFVLSDIPNTNIIFLEVDEKSKTAKQVSKDQTFGANIHDLLADSFFMSDGYMGDFAKQKIKETIEWLNNDNRIESKKEYFKKIIEIIDEPILKRKLSEMYSNVIGENLELVLIEKEIEMLEKRKKAININN